MHPTPVIVHVDRRGEANYAQHMYICAQGLKYGEIREKYLKLCSERGLCVAVINTDSRSRSSPSLTAVAEAYNTDEMGL